MISRVLAVTAFTAAVCLVPANPSLQAAGVTVDVAGMAFTPRVVKVPLGGTVTWRFQEGPHTTTSDQGFWSSGTRSSGDSFAHTFESAGTYPYHCTVHPHMQGKVKVRIKATGSPSSGWKIRWATTRGSGGTTYDVQVRKPGSHTWKTLKDDVRRAATRYDPAADGKHSVRARTNDDGQTSRWSPAKSLTVS